jgi:hypothetical protein
VRRGGSLHYQSRRTKGEFVGIRIVKAAPEDGLNRRFFMA